MCKSVCRNDVEKHPSEITNYGKIISKYTFTICCHIFQVQQRRELILIKKKYINKKTIHLHDWQYYL